LDKLIDALKKHGQIAVIDQTDLEKEYGVTWEEINEWLSTIESTHFITDEEVDGFEETTWHYKFGDYTIKDTTIYGIGAITTLELI
jgi:predicted transcriptional regulator